MNVLTRSLLLACTLLLLSGTSTTHAQNPTLSLQGQLTNNDGSTLPDGSYALTVRLYNTLNGGDPLWQEQLSLTTSGGVFNALLGLTASLADLAFDQPYYLGLSLDGGAELEPRTLLSASPYAMRARRLDAEALAAGDNVTITEDVSGALLISTTGGGGGGLAGVSHDASLTGDGTGGAPLSLADGAVTGVKLADGAVTDEKLADGAVTGVKLADGALVAGQNVTVTRNADDNLVIDALGGGGDGLANVAHDASLTGDGTGGNPLGLTMPLVVTGADNSGVVQGRHDNGNFGNLGGTTYGAFAQRNNGGFGYLGGPRGVGGSFNNNWGYLGGNDEGAYGEHNNGNFGSLGINTSGAYGQSANGTFGYLGGGARGAYGRHNNGNSGSLGSDSNGAYGQHNDGNFGLLGNSDYGAYGANINGNEGYLGHSNYGVSGEHSNGNRGNLGNISFGAYAEHNNGNLGYLASGTTGAFGRNDNDNLGYLGSTNYGAYGEHNNGNQGYFGGNAYGAYAENNNGNLGYLASNNDGAYGLNTNGNFGYLGGITYGSLGGNSNGTFGYLGGSGRGVYGEHNNGNQGYLGGGAGALGQHNNGNFGYLGHSNYGVYGEEAAGPWAGYFKGDVHVTGTLSKGGGAFKIDHPLDPQNRYLAHSFVESPDMMNVYNGNVTTDADGLATVELPPYFEVLNRDYRYQLTVIGQFAQAIVAGEVNNHRFVIQTDKPGVKVSWQVTGIRQDAWAQEHRIVVEEDKPARERGYYLHPWLFGQPVQRSVEWARDPEGMPAMQEERSRPAAQ